MGKIDKKAVGARIKSIREDRGMTMVEFGELLSAPQGVVSNWERGENLPNKNRLKKIATIANISVQDLLHGVKRYMYVVNWYRTEGEYDCEYDVYRKVFNTRESAHKWLVSEGFSKEREATSHNEYEYCKYGDRVFTMAAIMEMEVVE